MSQYQITLVPTGSPCEAESVRQLRATLKHALRSCKMRCMSAVEIREDAARCTGPNGRLPRTTLTTTLPAVPS